MKKINIAQLLLLPFSFSFIFTSTSCLASEKKDSLPDLTGKLVYHSYSSYDAYDSKIYLLDFESKKKICLSDSFKHIANPMNACFNPSGTEITFMGVLDNEWNIFKFNLETKHLENIIPDNDLRNEDPKYSPDGNKIAFKQGHWDNILEDLVYDLKEINLITKEITSITDDEYENSMPYYSSCGNYIYYAQNSDEGSKIYKVSRDSKKLKEEIYSEQNLKAYYPIVYKNYLYFTKWYSTSNNCDNIMRINTITNKLENLPFNSNKYDCSDPCPVSDKYIVISSTKHNSKGCYDLYLADNETGAMYSLDLFIDKVNDKKNALGACYYK